MTDKLTPTPENIFRIMETYRLNNKTAKFVLGELFKLQRKLPNVDVEKNVLKLARRANMSYVEAILGMSLGTTDWYGTKTQQLIEKARAGILASPLYEIMEEVTDVK